MKQLEAIGMVQFFLYERIDVDIGRNTAFLGPNGTGKTALLDALQTVLLSADENMMNFNAAGEGTSRARRLREYCLGIYGQTEGERCRSAANTYVNLVFRDTESRIPVTIGVSVSAFAETTEVVRNLYILPGVALSTAAHVENVQGHESVLPWRRFMQVAADLCRQAGTTFFPTTNGADFARRVYVEHLASPGERPNVRSIRSAFARSLKLNDKVTDLDEMLRKHLIEPRPTNVRHFRARLEQFREVRALIRRIKERIDRTASVADRYAVVQRERTVQANLLGLHAVYESERIAELLGEASERIETFERQIEASQIELQRAKVNHEAADAARTRAIESLNRDPEYLKQAGQADRLKEQQDRLTAMDNGLHQALEGLLALVAQSGRLPVMAGAHGDFEHAIALIDDMKQALQSHDQPDAAAIQTMARAVAKVHDAVRRELYSALAEAKAAKERLGDARLALERAQRGLSPVRPNTIRLQNVLHEAGIETTAVCDLVSISDARWQPAVEAYLASNVEALLVPIELEERAIDVYKSLKGASAVYGVKLAFPSRGRPWQAPGGGRYAAQLIVGENKAAVRYLQGELGKLALAETTHDLHINNRAISVEGMLSVPGGIDRVMPRPANELLIGRGQQGHVRTQAEREFTEAENALAVADQVAKSLQGVHSKMAPYADAEDTRTKLEEQFGSVAEGRGIVQAITEALTSSQSDHLARLSEAKAEADRLRQAAQEAITRWDRELTLTQERLTNTRTDRNRLESSLSAAQHAEKDAKQHPLYDAREVNRYRERYDDRHGEEWDPRLKACSEAAKKAGATAHNADLDAWQQFSQYAVDFDLTNHDIVSSEWQRAFQYVLDDKSRLQDLELAEQEVRAEEAYDAAVKVFRTDVAQALIEGFDAVREQIDSLNGVLHHAPEFSNGERYQFRHSPVVQYQALYDFLKRVREAGDAEEDMFSGSGRVPEEFRALVDGSADSELLQETSPLNDHRRFFSYDVEIFRESKSIGWLSKRIGPGSGGEHRTPLYVIFGAALAAAYGKARGIEGSGGLMMLDEAFEKMDPQNVRATADYLNSLGLQLIMAGPEADQGKMSSFLDIYYDMARFGTRTVQMTKNIVEPEARELLESDNFILHPELLDQAIKTFEEGASATG